MLKSNKPLQAKTNLKSKTVLKANTKPKKQKKPITQRMRKTADFWFSRYVRLRDCTFKDDGWYGTCITCTKTGLVAWIDEKGHLRFTRGWDNGHFVGRGTYITRFEDENCNLQCSMRCNNLRSGEYEKYKVALKIKYGENVPRKLEELAEKYPATSFHFTKEYLKQVILDSRSQVEWYEKQAKNPV